MNKFLIAIFSSIIAIFCICLPYLMYISTNIHTYMHTCMRACIPSKFNCYGDDYNDCYMSYDSAWSHFSR